MVIKRRELLESRCFVLISEFEQLLSSCFSQSARYSSLVFSDIETRPVSFLQYVSFLFLVEVRESYRIRQLTGRVGSVIYIEIDVCFFKLLVPIFPDLTLRFQLGGW